MTIEQKNTNDCSSYKTDENSKTSNQKIVHKKGIGKFLDSAIEKVDNMRKSFANYMVGPLHMKKIGFTALKKEPTKTIKYAITFFGRTALGATTSKLGMVIGSETLITKGRILSADGMHGGYKISNLLSQDRFSGGEVIPCRNVAQRQVLKDSEDLNKAKSLNIEIKELLLADESSSIGIKDPTFNMQAMSDGVCFGTTTHWLKEIGENFNTNSVKNASNLFKEGVPKEAAALQICFECLYEKQVEPSGNIEVSKTVNHAKFVNTILLGVKTDEKKACKTFMSKYERLQQESSDLFNIRVYISNIKAKENNKGHENSKFEDFKSILNDKESSSGEIKEKLEKFIDGYETAKKTTLSQNEKTKLVDNLLLIFFDKDSKNSDNNQTIKDVNDAKDKVTLKHKEKNAEKAEFEEKNKDLVSIYNFGSPANSEITEGAKKILKDDCNLKELHKKTGCIKSEVIFKSQGMQGNLREDISGKLDTEATEELVKLYNTAKATKYELNILASSDGTRHSMGFCVTTDGHAVIFDPNEGAVVCKSEEQVRDFFEKILQNYPTVNDHGIIFTEVTDLKKTNSEVTDLKKTNSEVTDSKVTDSKVTDLKETDLKETNLR